MFKKISLAFGLSFLSTMIHAQIKEMPLYEGKIPNSTNPPNTEKSAVDNNGVLRLSEVSVPTLTVYPAPSNLANGTAVIICPGGGYRILAASHEGSDVAKEFNKLGITAFVLKYRLPDDKFQTDRSIAPLQDAQQAFRLVRKNASAFGVKPDKIGIMGFSAGGHLAATTATHFDQQVGELADNSNVRPDFAILIYPVITMKDFTHSGSKSNLIGANASDDQVKRYSNETQVTSLTPPSFLVHASDDKAVPVKNSLSYYEACVQNGVKAELHVYQNGGHGFGLNNKTTQDRWFERLKAWLQANAWLN